jgi:hypothetical protein
VAKIGVSGREPFIDRCHPLDSVMRPVLNDLPFFDMRQSYKISRESRYVVRPIPVVISRPL